MTKTMNDTRQILGSMLLDPRSIPAILATGITATDMADEEHGRLFDMFVELHGRCVIGVNFDIVDAKEFMTLHSIAVNLGGVEYLLKMAEEVEDPTQAVQIARSVMVRSLTDQWRV